MNNKTEVLIVGAGIIAQEYVKVLLAQGKKPIIVSRGKAKANELNKLYPNVKVFIGGLELYLSKTNSPEYSIIATPIEYLVTATKLLIENGCKNILVEKPLTFSKNEANMLIELSEKFKSKVFIAFNRRAYQSVLKAKELIKADGGISSFHFDFTEAIFRINPLDYDRRITEFWGLANSSHVIDTAFYLGGTPNWMTNKQYGKGIDWHLAGDLFTGMGETIDDIPFTYHSNWGAPGKWNIEIMTPKRKLMFSPMERLKQQQYGTFSVEEVLHNYALDIDYKPGFFYQVESFINKKGLFNITELPKEIKVLGEIFNY